MAVKSSRDVVYAKSRLKKVLNKVLPALHGWQKVDAPYQSEDPNPTKLTNRGKKEKTMEDKPESKRLCQQKGHLSLLSHTFEHAVNKIVPKRY